MAGLEQDLDYNNDGKLSKAELIKGEKLKELGRTSKRFDSQRKMTWIAVASIPIVMLLLFSPLVDEGRINALAPIIQMFFIAQSGVIAAYFSSAAWANRHIHIKDSEEYDDTNN
jgi:hypothetical protein